MRRWVDDMSSSLLDSNTSRVLAMLRSGFPPSTPLKAQLLNEPKGKTYCAHLAAEKGLLPVLRLLADTAPSTLEAKNSYGLTPLLCACKSSEFATIRFLASRAKVDLSATDFKGNTAVHIAAAEGYKDLVEYLVEDLKLSPLVRNHDGELPLDVCSRGGFKGDIYQQAALEETALYLKTKFGAEIASSPIRGKKLGEAGKSRGAVTPIKRGNLNGESLGLNLRSVTPVDRLIRDRCKAVFAAVQDRIVLEGPMVRRNRPSHSLHSHLWRGGGVSPVKYQDVAALSQL